MKVDLKWNVTKRPDFDEPQFYVDINTPFEYDAFSEWVYSIERKYPEIEWWQVKAVQDAQSRLSPDAWLEVTYVVVEED